MSWNTQNNGQKVTVQFRVEVIWPTDNKLCSRDGTTRTEFHVIFWVKMIVPSPTVGEVLPLAVEIKECVEEWRDCN
jgi:hypothetical protein